ncbi:hypothetical protein G7Z17_g1472 [Cylindrodendrum hubeiense]|uniref:Uncharacterized protein n=1 Tax=Cylindrodendrum hubeiense TaxID=595255 RepID=A0A9P5HJL1_9HYPO|nr:hypothetical protein G7Z17_g1472 [Cylindrodendrum hubeiense]
MFLTIPPLREVLHATPYKGETRVHVQHRVPRLAVEPSPLFIRAGSSGCLERLVGATSKPSEAMSGIWTSGISGSGPQPQREGEQTGSSRAPRGDEPERQRKSQDSQGRYPVRPVPSMPWHNLDNLFSLLVVAQTSGFGTGPPAAKPCLLLSLPRKMACGSAQLSGRAKARVPGAGSRSARVAAFVRAWEIVRIPISTRGRELHNCPLAILERRSVGKTTLTPPEASRANSCACPVSAAKTLGLANRAPHGTRNPWVITTRATTYSPVYDGDAPLTAQQLALKYAQLALQGRSSGISDVSAIGRHISLPLRTTADACLSQAE